MFVDELLQHGALGQRGTRLAVFNAVHDAAVQQKPALAGVTQHLQAGVLPGQCNAGEVHMRGDVLAAHLRQRVGVCPVALVAHHGAHGALRVVVLVFGKAIVDQKYCPLHQVVSQRAHKAFALGVNFGQVVVGAGHVKRRAQCCGLVGMQEAAFMQRHPAFVPHTVDTRQQFDRHGVQHLVAHHHTAHVGGQGRSPLHFAAVCGQTLTLAGHQAA